MIPRVSIHTHTKFCDGRNSVEEMVLSAIEQGFSDFYYSAHHRDLFTDPHIHSHMELVFLLSGELILSVDGMARS